MSSNTATAEDLRLVKQNEEMETPKGWTSDDNIIRIRLKNYLQAHPEIKQSMVADAIGVADATISGFLSTKYNPGSIPGIAKKVRSWLEFEEQRALNPEKPKFVITSVAQDALTVLQYVSKRQVIGLIFGDAGQGKTMAIQYFISQNPGPVTLITAHPGIKNPKPFIRALMRAVKCNNLGTLDHEINVLVDYLSGTKRTIIIDEAQRLSYNTLEVLRYIQETAQIGVVFSGNEEIYTRLYGRGEAAFAQFYSRVAIRCRVNDVKRADIEMIFANSGLSNECLDKLYEYATSRGKLRVAVNIFMAAAEIAQAQNTPMTVKLLEAVRKKVQMEEGQ